MLTVIASYADITAALIAIITLVLLVLHQTRRKDD